MVAGVTPEVALGRAGKKSRTLLATMNELKVIDASLARDHEVDAILGALDARYIRPAAGGDIVRNPSVLPTGRNMHGFDPFRIPSALATHDGAMQARSERRLGALERARSPRASQRETEISRY